MASSTKVNLVQFLSFFLNYKLQLLIKDFLLYFHNNHSFYQSCLIIEKYNKSQIELLKCRIDV